MKVKNSSLVTFSFIMLGIYLVVAGGFYLAHDKQHALMFSVGAVVWIIGTLVHLRNTEQDTPGA